MPIVYVNYELQVHGLSVETEAQLLELKREIHRRLVETPLPFQGEHISDNDVILELDESAGALTS